MWIDQKFIVLGKIFKKEKGSLLDLGSRDQILKKFLPNEISYIGADISKNIDESNLIVNLNNKLDFGDNSYDFVTALDVAEHLDDPKSFLDEQGRMQPGPSENKQPTRPFEWDQVHAVVTFNSSITIKALHNGVPCFTNFENPCGSICESDFSKIETPMYKDR